MATVATASIPLVQREIIDDVIVTHRQSIWPLAGLLLIAAAVNFAGIYLRRYHGGRLSLDVQHELRTELFDSLTRLDGARQDEISTGQLVGRSISDLNMVQSILSMVPITLGNLALFILSIGIMVVLSPVLTIVTVTVAPALWMIALASRRRLFPASWHAQQQTGDVAGIVDEAIGGVRVVKGFGQEEQEQERLEDASSNLFASRLRMVRLTARYNPALTALPSLGMVGVLALGGWLAIHGSLTLGTFLAFSAYLAQMSGPVRTLTMMVTIGQEARASVIRVFDIIDSRPTITDKPGAAALPADATGISFDDVHFGYLPAEPVLRGLSLRVEPGETVAVVGASGSGKSTIALLLPRFYDPQSGSVRIGGRDIKDVTQDSLRAAIGLVMEDSFLFSATVGANIAYGRPDATREQIVAAAKASQAHEFIVRLPKGYDTMVGEQGLTLSGGQRQRVALARALVTDPRLLLLDDATSAIDPRLEAEIHAALREVMRGRTTLIIAHRRSTLNLADRIVVLDQGRVADTGTHEELSERCPLYRKLIMGPDEETPDGLEPVAGLGSAAGLGLAGPLVRPRPVPAVEDVLDGRGRALAGAGVAGGGRGRGRAGGASTGNITGTFASLPPSPELLAQVDALPPAKDVPQVEIGPARAADRQFSLRRLLRPLAVALIIGLVLDGLDAVAGLALPALVRNGIDHGVETKLFHAIVVVSLIGLAIVLADWVVNIAETMVVGRNGERLLFTLRVKLFAQLQRLGLDFYEREQSGRIMTRMTTDVDALSSFLQTGLITMVSSVLTFFGIHAALREVMRGRTTLIIAHRRSTLNLADRIVVLDQGRVADTGTHEELTERCPLYRQLIIGPDEEPATGPGPATGLAPRAGLDAKARLIRPRAGHTVEDVLGRLGGAGGRGAMGRSRGAGPGNVTGTFASLPPSPALLAQVGELPPAKDVPDVELGPARAADRQFSLRRLLRPLAVALIIGLVLDGLDAVAGLALPALVRNGIDNGVETKFFHAILVVSLIGLAIVLADWVINIAETMVVGRTGERLLFTLRVKLFAQLQRLGLDFYEREQSGRIMTRMTTDVDALSSFLQTGLITMVSSVLTFFGVLAALLIINLELGLAVLTIFPVLVVATLVFRKKSARAYSEAREKVAAVNADFAENVAGLRVTQSFRREPVNRDRFGALSSAFRVSRLRAQRYIAIYFPFVQTLSTAAGAIVLVLATGEMRDGKLTAGALIAYLLYIDLFFSPVQQLSQVFDGYQQAMVGLHRITDLLRLGTSTPPARQPVTPGRLRGRIELRDVSFSYTNTDANALSGINLTIEPGETVALVGQTGAGKSTLVKLIARFYDVTSGRVLVDGTDVRTFDLASYRHQLGVVPQESYLFAGTVRDSIAYARPGASDAEVEAAARATGAHEMIIRLSGGYNHEVSERGRNLSAGQRQLIALARAQLADPAILLLDEATAALDLAAEAAVNHAIGQLTAARTTIVVAHRLTTAARADRIVVLDQGSIAEAGTHSELLAAEGTYAALWDAFTGEAELVA